MLLALDYDETYTRDPEFWDMVIRYAKHRNHSVICVTARDERYRDEVERDLGGKVEAIICTNGRAKHGAAHQAGYMPSVWIDDSPLWIHTDALG
jgi:hydroxymethylpyrimidine pyrophosphatase-like HAD family hydrolase